ncbi:MAG: hypothetical protein M1819_007441 [Sarea resinae]|nr:MAG: hypothetical protein M1819_007441 [Sarea resinae]
MVEVETDAPPLAGKTIDLTLFAVTRAIDVLVRSAWKQYKFASPTTDPSPPRTSAFSNLPDSLIFAISSGTIMYSWFYHPSRLPSTYNHWISTAAAVDPRLITALRHAHAGTWLYGYDTGEAHLLQSMCADYSWPPAWGDPALTVPIPCEMVHMGTGPSCEKHALLRFIGAFKFALLTYLPLNLLMKSRSPSLKALRKALGSAARSSAFLGAFISAFYYSVCLARTRIGPVLLSKHLRLHKSATTTNDIHQKLDSGLCVAAGCVTCGASILLEAPKRRQEIAFFVAPRALATLFPRHYPRAKLWREQVAFALSCAVVLAVAGEDPAQVRGVLGGVLGRVLK